MPRVVIRPFMILEGAAAQVYTDPGLLPQEKRDAIVAAADEVARGELVKESHVV